MFITIQRLLPSYDPQRPLRPWLFGIAFRYAQRYRDKDERRSEQLDSSPEHSHPPVPAAADAEVDRHAARQLVVAALQRMKPARRAVFVMAAIDGHTAPEIAQALDMPLNTVYSRLRVARDEFAAAVRRLAGEVAP